MEKFSLKKSLFAVLVILISFSFMGCTREATTPDKLSFHVPNELTKTNSKTGAQSINKLKFVAANVRIDGNLKPFYQKNYDNHDSDEQPDFVEFIVENPPTGQPLLVQLLAVYEIGNTTGGAAGDGDGDEEIHYGDEMVVLETGQETTMSLDLTPYSLVGKEAALTGRLLDSANSGPTGVMGLYIQPPNRQEAHFAMRIESSEIWDGWFEAFAIESSEFGFTYKLEIPGQEDKVIFENLQLTSPMFTTTGKSHVAKFKIPAYKEVRGDGDVEVREEEEVVVGFFKVPGSSVNLSGKKVCYSDTPEAIMQAYKNDSSNDNLIYNPTGGTAGTDITATDGFYTNFGDSFLNASCDNSKIATGDAIRVYPQGIVDTEDSIIGRQGPFQRVKYSVDPWQGFSLRKNASNQNSIELKWKFLPGIMANNAITKTAVYAKYSPNGGDDGGGEDRDQNCAERAEESDYTKAGEASGESFNFTGISGNSVNSNNIHSWTFMLCPYKSNSEGRIYASRGVEDHCSGSCTNPNHFGWGVTNISDADGAFDSFSAGGIQGQAMKVVAVDSSSNDYDLIDLYSSFSASPGDEIMFLVVSASSTSSPECFVGEDSGESYHVGHFDSTRLLNVNSNQIKIPKGSFLGEMPSGTNLNSGHDPATNHCWIHAIKIPHFKDITIANSLYPSGSMDFTNGTSQFFVGFRANGLLTMNGKSIDAGAAGFAGVGNSFIFGGGLMGEPGSSDTYTGGMVEGATVSGGGGFGQGGDGATGTDSRSDGSGNSLENDGGFGWGDTGDSFSNYPRLLLGGAGAGDGSNGGNGGGIIFVTSKKANITGASYIKSYGETPSTAFGGGGAGGSINMNIGLISGDGFGSVSINANGGESDTSNGVGGGGYVGINICQEATANDHISLAARVINSHGTSAGGGVTNGASDGNTDVVRFNDPNSGSNDLWQCKYLPQF